MGELPSPERTRSRLLFHRKHAGRLRQRKLRLIESDTNLCPGIDLRLFDGHTPGQIAPYITTPKRTYIFAGDVIPLAASVSPLWISAYDTYPVVSYNEKMRMLEEAVSEKQAIIYCHDAYTQCTTVKKVNDFFKADRKSPLFPSGETKQDYYRTKEKAGCIVGQSAIYLYLCLIIIIN